MTLWASRRAPAVTLNNSILGHFLGPKSPWPKHELHMVFSERLSRFSENAWQFHGCIERGSISTIDHFQIWTRFWVENANPNVTLTDVFSEGVGPVRMWSFVPIWNRRGAQNGKGFSQRKSTQIEFHRRNRLGFIYLTSDISGCVDFC
jgi:hypothetical protein